MGPFELAPAQFLSDEAIAKQVPAPDPEVPLGLGRWIATEDRLPNEVIDAQVPAPANVSSPECKDEFYELAPGRQCKWGASCRNREQCTYYHGNTSDLARQFCNCDNLDCLKPHPYRRKKRKRLTCNKCGDDNLVTNCPYVKSFKCHRFGHLANACKKKSATERFQRQSGK